MARDNIFHVTAAFVSCSLGRFTGCPSDGKRNKSSCHSGFQPGLCPTYLAGPKASNKSCDRADQRKCIKFLNKNAYIQALMDSGWNLRVSGNPQLVVWGFEPRVLVEGTWEPRPNQACLKMRHPEPPLVVKARLPGGQQDPSPPPPPCVVPFLLFCVCLLWFCLFWGPAKAPKDL